jgi:saccharopine dehydrogenase (NAD+, L-lysine forming)
MKIGIIREGKTPPDARVALTPQQCAALKAEFDLEITVEPSPTRCYSDDEYRAAGITVSSDLSRCDLLLGIKEVPIGQLIPNTTYCFFSHTIKKQPSNKKLLQAVLAKNIRLVDWETLTNEQGERLIAFGRWAGIVGAHNGMMTWAERTHDFTLQQMKYFHDFAEAKTYYKTLQLPAIKIVLTGTGRVANGAAEVLEAMGIQRISANDFLTKTYEKCVFTQLGSADYVQHRAGKPYSRADFHANPQDYETAFLPFTKVADMFINGIFWKKGAPVFYDEAVMRHADFKIKVIADITCDMMPESSVPSTLIASTIAEPIFGYDIATASVCAPHKTDVIDMMTIDNLPNELPRDASKAFGEQFVSNVLPHLYATDTSKKVSPTIIRAMMTENGELTPNFKYLQDYVSELVNS